jgi:predicted Zn-dependent protease
MPAAAAAADADARARLLAPALARTAAAGMTAAGLAAVGETVTAVASSAGSRRAFAATHARLDIIALDGPAAARVGHFAAALDAVQTRSDALAVEACERAARGRDPIELPPGAYDVVLEPAAVAELLEWLALTSLGARAVEDGTSCLAGRAGERITGPVTVYDDARTGEAGCPTAPFDAEGTPRTRVVLLDGGVARAPVHDRASAAAAGVASTGHAPPLDEDLFDSGPVPQHLHLGAGDDDTAALLGRVERGLWVSRFHYVNGLLDTRRALMTGMTRDGLFLVENGQLGRGVRNLRWTEALLEALGRTGGVTRARQVVPAGLGPSVLVCPTVLVRGWRFTGASK